MSCTYWYHIRFTYIVTLSCLIKRDCTSFPVPKTVGIEHRRNESILMKKIFKKNNKKQLKKKQKKTAL